MVLQTEFGRGWNAKPWQGPGQRRRRGERLATERFRPQDAAVTRHETFPPPGGSLLFLSLLGALVRGRTRQGPHLENLGRRFDGVPGRIHPPVEGAGLATSRRL